MNFLQFDHLVGGNLLLQALQMLRQVKELLGLEHLKESLKQLVINFGNQDKRLLLVGVVWVQELLNLLVHQLI